MIDWDEYKQFKKDNVKKDKLDNFELLLEFMKSYYNTISPFEIFDTLMGDEIGQMMLEKRDISKVEQLEEYLYTRTSK